MTLSEESKRAIKIAQSFAKENLHQEFSPGHLLLGLFHNDVGLATWLVYLGKDIHFLRDWAEYQLESLPKSNFVEGDAVGDGNVKAIVKLAELISLQLAGEAIEPIHLLAASLKPGGAFSADQLRSFPLTYKELVDEALEDRKVTAAVNGSQANKPVASDSEGNSTGMTALLKFCVDKTELAREGKLDPIIGRDEELRLMLEILVRRTKPNVLLAGEPGVGKTALIEGFAQAIVEGKVPGKLKNTQLFELDLGSLVAGASYKGEVEDRIKSIIREVKQLEKAILFIDEIHILLQPNGTVGTGVAQLLKPELARGELTVIGATTLDEFRQYIEKDEAFSRRFEKLTIPEPGLETATRMVSSLLPRYEVFHGLKADTEVAEETVRLASRYIKDRRLPDAAIDLLDRTMAAISITAETAAGELKELYQQLTLLPEQVADKEQAVQLQSYRWLLQQFQNRISPILREQLEDDIRPETLELVEELHRYLADRLERLTPLAESKKEKLTKQDVAAMISAKTGIPLGKLQSNERDKLMQMDSLIRKRVVGQDHAISALAASILEARAGLSGGKQPVGAFFLLGPTGTGKTELAKSIADFLFNDESFLIRFDMSEFKEEHSAALLYGAPPGYVGYEQGGLLVNLIREKPYSVVLFDEIEKAHPSVFDLFLQILDEGKLHDRLGKEGDFSNAIVLFTSNIGSEFIVNSFTEGQVPTSNQLTEIMSRHFRPEFLGRINELGGTIPFAPLNEQNAVQIFNIHLKALEVMLNVQGITLELSTEAREHLALNGFSPKYGARPLKGVIRSQLRRPISRMIIAGEVGKGQSVTVELDGEKELVWKVEKQQV